MRLDQRQSDQLRPVRITTGYLLTAEGSAVKRATRPTRHGTAFLGHDRVVRERGADRGDDQGVGVAVGIRHEVRARRLRRDAGRGQPRALPQEGSGLARDGRGNGHDVGGYR